MKLIIALLMLLSQSSFAQTDSNGILKGVVTYFFNDNYGYKPDVGAKVYALNKDSIYVTNLVGNRMKIGWDTIDNYNIIQRTRQIKQMEAKNSKSKHSYHSELGDSISKIYNLSDLNNQKAWDNYCQRVTLNLMMITLSINTNTQKVTVDGAGNYSLHLAPGKYFIVIRSSGRNGRTNGNLTPVNSDGQIFTTEVNIIKGKETILDREFSQY